MQAMYQCMALLLGAAALQARVAGVGPRLHDAAINQWQEVLAWIAWLACAILH